VQERTPRPACRQQAHIGRRKAQIRLRDSQEGKQNLASGAWIEMGSRSAARSGAWIEMEKQKIKTLKKIKKF
jgi:hypothetical protein